MSFHVNKLSEKIFLILKNSVYKQTGPSWAAGTEAGFTGEWKNRWGDSDSHD